MADNCKQSTEFFSRTKKIAIPRTANVTINIEVNKKANLLRMKHLRFPV